MRNTFTALLLAGALALGAGPAAATDQDDAAAAARQILESLQAQRYERLWDDQTSDFFKSQMTRDAFVQTMVAGREPLGAAGDSVFMQMNTADADDATGYEGPIYAFSYRNVYKAGVFIERIVVIKDDDGVFRLSGLWGAPLPQQPAAPQ